MGKLRTAALITGASAGIGRAYAIELAKRGEHDLILVARRVERLQQLSQELAASGFKGRIEVIPCDLRGERERTELAGEVEKRGLQVGLLINNAGFGYLGTFLTDSVENQRDMILTNCLAPLHLAQLFLPAMVRRGFGHVINLASVAAYPPIPFMATYGATKAFLLNWSVAVREELRGTGVSLLAVCPGPTESEFHLVAGAKEKVALVPAMSAEEVVLQSLAALDQAVLINGWKNRVMAESTRLLSKGLVARIGRRLVGTRVSPERLPS